MQGIGVFDQVNTDSPLLGDHIVRKARPHRLCNILELQITLGSGQNHCSITLRHATAVQQDPTLCFLWERHSTLPGTAIKHFPSPRAPLSFKENTSLMFSPSSSDFSFSGQRRSRSAKRTSSPPFFWYCSGVKCSTTSSARPFNNVQMKLPLASGGSLSIVSIRLMAHCFQRLYSL